MGGWMGIEGHMTGTWGGPGGWGRGGGWEMEVVDPEELARGELKEETGLHAATMTYLGFLWIAYGFARQKQHVFLAMGLTSSECEPDAEEHDLEVRCVSVEEFEEMML